MKTIYKGNNFVIQWSIMDAVTSLPFDFNDLFVEFIVYSDNYKGRISGCKISGNKMQAEIMANTLPVGVYDIVCSYKNSMNSGHCICRRAFNITRNPDFCSNTDSILIESYASPLKLENMDINYLGHFPSEGVLPDSDKPAWALVGTLKFARPWFFYTANVVPPGFQTGWNDLSEVLGTYDLTADKVSIFDFNLVTEYNVSRNHPNIKRDFSNDWGMAKGYYPEYDKYKPCKVYNEGERANMPDYTENTFIALRETYQPPFITIEVSSEFTLGEAVAITPEQYRYPGIRLTFVNSKTHQAETWFWLGGEWEDEDKWIKPISDVTINNLPDEEDISTTKDSIPRLQLKDKLHDKNSYSGLGRCYLRKNMVDGVNVLTQDMFTNADGSPKKNTRYIIQYDYDLNGDTIEVPDGCVLDFEGGSLRNGNIKLKNTALKAAPVQLFENVTFNGKFNADCLLLEWFGAKGDGVTDDTNAWLQVKEYLKVNGGAVTLLNKTYAMQPLDLVGLTNISIQGFGFARHPWKTTTCIKIISEGEVGIRCTGEYQEEPTFDNDGNVVTKGQVPTEYATAVLLKGFYLDCNNKVGKGINCHYNVEIDSVEVRYSIGDGIVIEAQAYPIRLKNVQTFYNGRDGVRVVAQNTTVYTIDGLESAGNGGYGLHIEGGNSCSIKNATLQSNKRGGLLLLKREDSDFTHPQWLGSLLFENLYTEANGTLEDSDVNYDGNYAVKIVGLVADRLFTNKIDSITFINSKALASAKGKSSLIEGTSNIRLIGSLGFSVDYEKNVEYSIGTARTENLRIGNFENTPLHRYHVKDNETYYLKMRTASEAIETNSNSFHIQIVGTRINALGGLEYSFTGSQIEEFVVFEIRAFKYGMSRNNPKPLICGRGYITGKMADGSNYNKEIILENDMYGQANLYLKDTTGKYMYSSELPPSGIVNLTMFYPSTSTFS